jgi:hypothetical protein
VVNVFAAAMSGTLLNAERLREGMAQVGATASALNMGLEETVAVLGLLNSAGSVGGIAGTRLKNVLVRLAAPNQVLLDLLGGVTLKMDGLAVSMEALKDADPGAIFKAFGRIAAPAVLVLRKQTAAMQDLEEQITGTQKAQEMFEVQMNTLGSQFKIFKSQLQENMIAVFTALRDSGVDVIQGLTRGLQRLKPVIVGVVATVIEWVRENKAFLGTLLKVGAAVLGVVVAVNLLTNPITWLIAAVVILSKIWAKWGDKIKSKTNEVTGTVLTFARTFIEANEESVLGVLSAFKGLFNFIIGTLVLVGLQWADLGRFIWDVTKKPLNWIWEKVKFLGNGIAKVFAWLGGEVANTFEKIQSEADKELDSTASLFARTQAAIAENAAQAYGVDYVGAIGDGLTAGLDIAKTKLGELEAAVKSTAAAVVQKGHEMGGAIEAPGTPGTQKGTEMDSAVAAHRAAQEARVQAEIATALKVENERRGALVRTIGFEQTYTEAWLAAKLEMIRSNYNEEEIAHSDNAEAMAEIAIAKAADVAAAKQEHNQGVYDHWVQLHQAELWAIGGLEVAYDTFFDSLLSKHMTTKKRIEAIQRSLERYIIKSFANVVKETVKNELIGMAVSRSAKDKEHAKDKFHLAKIGAGKAFSAFANIPIIGPILGAAAAAAAFAFLMAFNKGGLVPGLSAGRDSVPAILTPREFVVSAPAVRTVGAENLDYINRTGQLPGGGGGGGDINISVSSGGSAVLEEELTAYLEDEVAPRLEEIRARRRYSGGE